VDEYLSTGELVAAAKRCLGIDVPNSEMSDREIKAVARFIGRSVSHCRCECGKRYCHSIDLLLMLIVSAVEFPKFFSKYGLFEEN
jgi:hypothetical protein